MADTDSIRLCAHCGKAEVIGRGTKRYCSPACKAASKKARRRGYNVSRPGRRRDADCLNCGKPFKSRPSGCSPGGWTVCCSVKCAQNHRHARARLLKPIVVRTMHGHCVRCGKHFAMQQHGCLYCSKACAAYEWSPSRMVCVYCGRPFLQERRWQRTCSDTCLHGMERKHHRIAKSKRRARARGVGADSIDPLAVFERDKWRCKFCGVRTPRSLRGTCDDRAPELDHIITLADGGSHTWGNVQCACRKCNGLKGARSMGQMGLGFAA